MSVFPQLECKLHETGVFVLSMVLSSKHVRQCLAPRRYLVHVSNLAEWMTENLPFHLLPVLSVDSLLLCVFALSKPLVLICHHLSVPFRAWRPEYRVSQKVSSNWSSFPIVPSFGMLLFIPVLSVSTGCLVVQLSVSWTRSMGHSCLPLTSRWHVLSKCISEYNKCNIVFLVKQAAFVSPAAQSGSWHYAPYVCVLIKSLRPTPDVLKRLWMGMFLSSTFLFFRKACLWYVTKLGLQKFQLLIMGRESGLRIQMGGLWGARGVSFLSEFHFCISFFPPFEQIGFYFQANMLNFPPNIYIFQFFSLCYWLPLPSLRENSDTPTMYKQMLGNCNALFLRSTFSWAALGPVCVLRLLTLAFYRATGKYVILSLPQHVSCPQGAQWQPSHNLSSLS